MHTVRSAEGSISQSRLDQWCIDYADSLSVEDQGEQVAFQSVGGATGRLRRGEILLHVANHKTYHRGYVAVVLYQLGGRPPVMDLPVFLRDAPRVLCGAQQEAARSDRTA